MNTTSPMRRFDPHKLAHYEKENYVAYYRKDWLKLLGVSVSMVKEAFGLSLPQAIYGAYLVARAEMAFAPYPRNDLPRSLAYMRRFYAMVKRAHRVDFDVEEAARLEVDWWVAHRELFARQENQGLADALARLYSTAYGVQEAEAREAARHRAQGMLFSDLWVREGMKADSPLLAKEEVELAEGYAALRQAIEAPAGGEASAA